MIRRIIFTSSICILCSIRCFAQAGPIVTYLATDTVTAGAEMTAIKPTSAADKEITYAVNPQLPAGFKFDVASGVISGKPAAVSSADYKITATENKISGVPFTLKIVVRPAGCSTCGAPDKPATSANCTTSKCSRCLSGGEWLLVFTPVILFLVFLTVFLVYINSKSGQEFSLKLALSESIYPSITEVNAKYAALTIEQLIDLQKGSAAPAGGLALSPSSNNFFPTTIVRTDAKFRPSMSRLIAFLTSATSMVIGIGLSCFFIYWYLKTGCVPDVGKLTEVLLAMGIGVVPYAANKLGNGLNAKNATS